MRWKKNNDIQWTKKQNGLEQPKMKNPPPSKESHPVTDPLGMAVNKQQTSILPPNLNTLIILNIISLSFIKNGKSTWNSTNKKQNGLKQSNTEKNHPPSPVLRFNTLCIYMKQIWYENRYKSSSREERRHGTTLSIKTRHKSSSSWVETRKQQTNSVGSAA